MANHKDSEKFNELPSLSYRRRTIPTFNPRAAFGDKIVEIYDNIRSPYPTDQVTHVIEELHITPESVVADIGAGTGRLTKEFAGKCSIRAIEPNESMRGKFINNLSGHNIEIYDGNATQTKLKDESVDCIIIGDAAHWLHKIQKPVIKEFKRILKPNGHIAVFTQHEDQNSDIIKELDRLISENCAAYNFKRFESEKQIRDPETLAIRHGEHLVELNGSTSHTQKIVEEWHPDNMYDYLLSKSGTAMWARSNKESTYDNIISPIFDKYGDKGILQFPIISHVLMGTLRKKTIENYESKAVPITRK